MNDNTALAFKEILKRIHLEDNYDKRCGLFSPAHSDKEQRIWDICKAFWPVNYADRIFFIDKYIPNQDLDDPLAKRYIEELTSLLDELEWAK